MSLSLTNKGKTAKRDTISDLDTVINNINSAIDHLQMCKGIGAEQYIAKLQSLAGIYEGIRRCISSLN